jgi:hypothetical protein
MADVMVFVGPLFWMSLYQVNKLPLSAQIVCSDRKNREHSATTRHLEAIPGRGMRDWGEIEKITGVG